MCGYHRFLTVSLIENEYKKKKKDRGSTGRERLTQPGACTIFLKTGTRQFESKMDHRWSTLTLYSSLISVHVLFVATAHLALLCHLNVSLWMHIPLVFTAAPKEHSTLSFNPFKLSLFLYRCPLRVALCRSLYLFTLTLHRVDLLPSFCVLAVFWLICGCSEWSNTESDGMSVSSIGSGNLFVLELAISICSAVFKFFGVLFVERRRLCFVGLFGRGHDAMNTICNFLCFFCLCFCSEALCKS